MLAREIETAGGASSTVRRRILLPLGVYLGVTIGVPFSNGAWARVDFWKHALEVVAIASVLAALHWASSAVAGSVRRRSFPERR